MTKTLTMLNDTTMHIFFASDDKFTLPLTNAISSILRNANLEDKHHFYILDKDISSRHKSQIERLKAIKDFEIEYIKIDDYIFRNCPLTKECKHISLQTYYRYLIPLLKPDLEKVLYLDCDILVKKSLNELWNTKLNDTYCGVVEDMYNKTDTDAKRLGLTSYFNAGILLINNKKWVAEKIEAKLFENTKKLYDENNLIWQDQDVLNFVFKENVTWLNPRYNFQQNCYGNYSSSKYSKKEITNAEEQCVIFHYNAVVKPWIKGYKCKFKKNEYYQEMFNNKFFGDLFLLFLKQIIHTIYHVRKVKKLGFVYKTVSLLGFDIKLKPKLQNKAGRRNG